ncbi:MAG: hypothetical protein U9O85_00390 [Euryarchaeota archaeon]|nr:hypothetical protein [Euryarchaeota archaeon]
MCAPISVAMVGGAAAAQAIAISQIMAVAVLGSIFTLNSFHPLKRLNRKKVGE